jgi:hypothetical protein
MTFAMTGAVLAFLRFNHPPARVFLGDAGSMLIGYFLSVSIVSSATTADHATYALVPLFALAFPLADTFISMARRWLRGHPLSRAAGRHIHPSDSRARSLAEKPVQAGTIAELGALLDESAAELGLVDLSIIPGTPHYPGPKLPYISPLSARPYRIDYPIAWEEGGHTAEMVLSLWCERPDERRHMGAERIAVKLGAALERWAREHPAAVGAETRADSRRLGLHGKTRVEETGGLAH